MTRVELTSDENPSQTAFIIECDPMRFGGSRATMGSTLWVPAYLATSNSAQLLALGGWLRVSGENDGLVIPMQPLLRNEPYLRAPITDEQIARLERKRAGQVLFFDVVLRAIGFRGTAAATPSTFSASFQPTIVIQRDEWLKILALLGAGTRRLIELPAAPRDLGGLWDKASRQIDAAAFRLASGDSGAAMSEARTAMEGTLEAAANAMNLPRAKAEPLGPFATRVSARIREQHKHRGSDPYAAVAAAIDLAADVFSFASHPMHNGLETSERINAELALSLVSTLYTYFARLPNAESGLLPSQAPLP